MNEDYRILPISVRTRREILSILLNPDYPVSATYTCNRSSAFYLGADAGLKGTNAAFGDLDET
jgi:hypothetical protein